MTQPQLKDYGDVLYGAARAALAEGLDREQYMQLVGFLWSQAASDHARAMADEVLKRAKAPGHRRPE